MASVAALGLPGSSAPEGSRAVSRTTPGAGLSSRRPRNTGARKRSSGVQLAYFTWQTSSGFTQVIPRSGLGRSAKGHRGTISGWRRECRPASSFWSKPVPTLPTQRQGAKIIAISLRCREAADDELLLADDFDFEPLAAAARFVGAARVLGH